MINMWIKMAIAEVCGIPCVLSFQYHFLPVYLSIPLIIVSSFAGVYCLRDANNKLKENLKKYNLESENQ